MLFDYNDPLGVKNEKSQKVVKMVNMAQFDDSEVWLWLGSLDEIFRFLTHQWYFIIKIEKNA